MIANRRVKIDDPHREALPDSPDSDPREVLEYLRRHSRNGVPTWVRQADVCDALTINNWLWWDDRRRELHFLREGLEQGLSLAQLGSQVGVGKQGLKDRIDRLEALLTFDRPDEKIIRQARRETRNDSQPQGTAEDRWLAAHRDELTAAIATLIAQADHYGLKDADRDWLDELAVDARDDVLTPGTMTMLGLATAELRTSPAVLALGTDGPYKIHVVLNRADRLRSQFAELGAKARAISREPARSTRRR
jgi:hypothetical protein